MSALSFTFGISVGSCVAVGSGVLVGGRSGVKVGSVGVKGIAVGGIEVSSAKGCWSELTPPAHRRRRARKQRSQSIPDREFEVSPYATSNGRLAEHVYILHAFGESGRGVRRQAAYLVQAGVADHEVPGPAPLSGRRVERVRGPRAPGGAAHAVRAGRR